MAGSRLVIPSQQPVQSTGLPYAGGLMFFYLSGTSTLTPTYQDSGLTTPNTNPVDLDSSGNVGNVFLDPGVTYKIVLEDSSANQVWTYDPVYPLASTSIQGLVLGGISTGTADAQILTGVSAPTNGQTVIWTAGFTNTSPMTLATTAPYGVYQPGPTGPVALAGGEITVGTTYISIFVSSLNSNAGGWQLIAPFSLTALGVSAAMVPVLEASTTGAAYVAMGGAISPPAGRLTLTTGVPVLTATVTAATSIIFTPYLGNQIPSWNGTAWQIATFTEISQLLNDTTHSPAAAVAGSFYDAFVWFNSGAATLSRGPAWTNATTRALGLTRVNGFLTNSAAITNGPAAGYGFFVGSFMTDVSAATVTFAPNPPATSGGPSTGSGGGNAGAWVGLWNEYNRIILTASGQDDAASWAYTTSTWRSADNTNNNRITLMFGGASDSISATYGTQGTTSVGGNYYIGVGVNSTTTPSGKIGAFATTNIEGSAVGAYAGPSSLGQQFVQALEYGNTGVTFYGQAFGSVAGIAMLISVQSRF